MDTTSVAYVLCRIEDDSSLTPVSQHEDILTGIAAGGYAVEVEDFDYAYALYAGAPSTARPRRAWHPSARAGSATVCGPRGVAVSTPVSRIATTTTLTSLWHERSWLLLDEDPTRSVPARDAWRDLSTTLSVVRGWLASGAVAVGGWWFTSTLS